MENTIKKNKGGQNKIATRSNPDLHNSTLVASVVLKSGLSLCLSVWMGFG